MIRFSFRALLACGALTASLAASAATIDVAGVPYEDRTSVGGASDFSTALAATPISIAMVSGLAQRST